MFAALFRKAACGGEDSEEVLSAVTRFREDLRYSYRIVEFEGVTAERHRLRAYDCLELATLLILQGQRVAFELAPLVLLSSGGN